MECSLDMSGQITTIDELEALYYGYNRNQLLKANDPLLTSTTGVFNTVYGAYAWALLNLEANAFGVLPKYPWDKSGVRFVTAKPVLTTTNSNTVLGGFAEGGAIAETAKPKIETVDLKPKSMQLPFSASEVMEWLANHSKDDIWGGLGSLRLYMATQHKDFINQAIMADRSNAARTTAGAFAGTNDFETLDAIVSSYAEKNAISSGSTLYWNPWNGALPDSARDSSSAASKAWDATVISPSGTIGTQGILTDNVIRTGLRTVRKAIGKDPTVLLGSHEAYSEVQGLYMPSVRIQNPYSETLVQVDVNGIQTFKGTGVGIHVDTVYGIPYIPTKDAPTDQTGEIGRIFGLDTSDAEGFGYPRTGIMVAIPTEYYEATRRSPGYPFVNSAFIEKAVFRTSAEVVCRSFTSAIKFRDLKL